jgi:transcriptional regulator with XRE-family HTH domain
MNVGSNIKKLRELKNITRDAMAADLEMSVSGYSKIERDEVDLTISKIKRIAEVLEIDMSQILNFDASQIFNVTNNNLVQGLGAKADTIHFHSDDYREKYIKQLESENQYLKSMLKKKDF